MSRTYDENMPIAQLMGKINSGKIKRVSPRYYDQDMPIAELMRKINSGEIKKIEPRKSVRPRRKLIIVPNSHRFQEDVWKLILEYLLSPASKVMVKMRTANALWMRAVFAKCGYSYLLGNKWTKAKHLEYIIAKVKKPFDHHNNVHNERYSYYEQWLEVKSDASRMLCDKIMAEDFRVKITQRDIDSYEFSKSFEREFEYLYQFEEDFKDNLPTKLTGITRQSAIADRADELRSRESWRISYYRGL